jgi:hypothetical protein
MSIIDQLEENYINAEENPKQNDEIEICQLTQSSLKNVIIVNDADLLQELEQHGLV